MLTNRIKRKEDFSFVFKKRTSLNFISFNVQYAKRSSLIDINKPRYGVIASKKVGNAVKRNFAKRRVRALENIITSFGKNDLDYVVVIKKELLSESFQNLSLDLRNAMTKITKITS